MAENNIPEKKFVASTISATIWQNKGTDRFGNEISYRTISFDRRYKDKAGEWKSTNSLRVNDLPKAMMVLGEAYKYILLKERHSEKNEPVEGSVFTSAEEAEAAEDVI